MYRHLLVPLDASELSVETVVQAVQFARALDARITFFHLEQAIRLKAFAQAEVAYISTPEDGSYALAARTRELLTRAESAARAWGVPCSSLAGKAGEVHAAIAQAAQGAGCDLIFMASHGRLGRVGMALGSHTLKVLTGAELPVLVRAVHEADPGPAALAAIRAEHRSLAAVLHAAQHLVDNARLGGPGLDLPTFRAVLHYLRAFPMAVHHPKEEQWLFRRLRARTSALDAELEELERQHQRDTAMVDELAAMAERCAGVEPAPLAALAQALERYAKFTWEHLGREEGVILPAARHHLRDADWAALEAAFAAHQEPGFDARQDFEALRQHLLEVAARAG